MTAIGKPFLDGNRLELNIYEPKGDARDHKEKYRQCDAVRLFHFGTYLSTHSREMVRKMSKLILNGKMPKFIYVDEDRFISGLG